MSYKIALLDDEPVQLNETQAQVEYKVSYGSRSDYDLGLISIHRDEYRSGLLSDRLVSHHLLLLSADLKECDKVLCPESGIPCPHQRDPQIFPEADFHAAAEKSLPHLQMSAV